MVSLKLGPCKLGSVKWVRLSNAKNTSVLGGCEVISCEVSYANFPCGCVYIYP